MAIKVYNTLTKKKEEFVPLHPGKAICMFAALRRTTTPISATRAPL